MTRFPPPPPKSSVFLRKTALNSNKPLFFNRSNISILTAAVISALAANSQAAVPQASPFSAVPSYLENKQNSATTSTITYEKPITYTKTKTETERRNASRTDIITTTETSSGDYEKLTAHYTIQIPQTRTVTKEKKVTTASSTVKPRMLLIFDDSGSMTQTQITNDVSDLKEEKGYVCRDVLVKTGKKNSDDSRNGTLICSIQNLMRDPKYSDGILWQAFTINGDGGAGIRRTPLSPNWTNGKDLYDGYISKIGTANAATPTTAAYVWAANEMFRNIKYSCQKNFMVVLADGDTNFDTYEPHLLGQTSGFFNLIAANGSFPFESSQAAWQIPALRSIYELQGDDTTSIYKHLPSNYHFAMPTYVAAKHSGAACLTWAANGNWCPWNKQNPDERAYLYLTSNKGDKCKNLFTPTSSSWALHEQYCGMSNKWNGIYNGIEYFSDKLYNKDLKPDTERDIEGNPFAGKQNIQTFSIAFGNHMSAQGEAYVIEAARVDDKFKNKNPNHRRRNPGNDGDGYAYYPETGYYYVSGSAELKEVFSEIFDNVLSTSVSTSSSNSSISNSAVSTVANTGDAQFVKGETTKETVTNTTPNKPDIDTDYGDTSYGEVSTSQADDENTTSSPSSTTQTNRKTESLYATSVATPINISTLNLDVSMFPDAIKSTADDEDTSAAERIESGYGVIATLGINTGNWASYFAFFPMFNIQLDNSKKVYSVVSQDKYTCTLTGYTTDKNNYTCYWKDDYLYPTYPSKRRLLMQVPDGSDYAEFGLTDNGKKNNEKHAIYKNFGFTENSEFDTGFLPWILRDGTVSDKQIEENVEKLALSERLVTKYRDRLDNTKNAIERQMGDVVDSSPITIPEYEPINSKTPRDRAKYMLVGANDGMLYAYKRNTSSNSPYQLDFNYLPYKMPRERYAASNSSSFTTFLETLGNVLPLSVASSDYGTAANEHIYGINGALEQIRTASLVKNIDGKTSNQLRERVNFVTGTMGQGGRGVFSLLAIGRSPKDNISAVGFDDELTKGGNWENFNDSATTENLNNPQEKSINLGYTINIPVVSKTATDWTNEQCVIATSCSRTDADSCSESIKQLGSCSSGTTETLTMPKAYPNRGEIRYTTFVANGFPTGDKIQSFTSNVSYRDNHDSAPTLYIFDSLGLNFKVADFNSTHDPAVNAETKAGDLIKKISVPNPTENAYQINTLGSPTVVDIDFDGIADVVYAGDYSGDLWRFDLRGKVSDWQAMKIFSGSPTQPITAAPAVYRILTKKLQGEQYMVAFGTGSDVYREDRQETEPQQRIYAIRDDLRVTPSTVNQSNLKFENSPSGEKVTIKYPISASNLKQRSFSTRTRKGNLERIATKQESTVGFDKDGNFSGYGWYIDLEAGEAGISSSERVIAKPQMVTSAVFFTSRKYDLRNLGQTTSSETVNQSDKTTQEGDWIQNDAEWSDWTEVADSLKKTEGTPTSLSRTLNNSDNTTASNNIEMDEAKQKTLAEKFQGDVACGTSEIDQETGLLIKVECGDWQDEAGYDNITEDDARWKLVQSNVSENPNASKLEESCSEGDAKSDIFQIKHLQNRVKKLVFDVTSTQGTGTAIETITTQKDLLEWIEERTRNITLTKTDIETWDVSTTVETESRGSVEGETWFFAVDILTGGNLETSGVKVAPPYDTDEEEPDPVLIGLHYNKITSPAIIQPVEEAMNVENAISVNGEYRSGDDQDMTVSPQGFAEKFQDNRCMKAKSLNAILNANPDPEFVGILPPPCHGVFMRTSLREIRGIWK